MSLFKSKEIETLRNENEELKTKFHFMYEKEQSVKQLEEIVKNLREEATELSSEKSELTDTITNLQNNVVDKKDELRALDSKLVSLQEMKEELQNTLLSYSNQVDDFEAELNDARSRRAAIAGEADAKNKILENFENKKGVYQKQLGDLSLEISKLQKLKQDLINKQDAKLHEISKLEANLIRENETNTVITRDAAALSEKIAGMHKKEMALNNDIELREKQILELNNQITKTENQISNQNKTLEQLISKEENLQNNLNSINDEMKIRRKALEIDMEEERQQREENLILELKQIEKKYIEDIEIRNIESVKKTEEKEKILHELEHDYSTLKEEYDKYVSELSTRQESIEKLEALLSNLATERDKLVVETGEREKEVFNLDQTIRIKTEKLHLLNLEISSGEKQISEANADVEKARISKAEVEAEAILQQEKINQALIQQNKLEELIPLLEKRKIEIELSNSELENRFTKMFQKFTSELNEINKRRNILEQVVLKKEKDLEEKDQLLFEKIASLEESQRIINMRQAELDSIEDSVGNINDKKEIIQKDLRVFESQALERKRFNESIKIETELLLEKKTAIEKTMQELLNMMIDGYSKGKERRSILEREIKDYEENLTEYHMRVDDSIARLEEMQTSLKTAKIEFEDIKGQTVKMIALKKRLHEQISKHQSALGRYQQLRDKIKTELTFSAKDDSLVREK
ncbi:MAG: hypothetical protein K8H86_12405 [Ignavibacteriaceae bacterium]|nr:hypothetical protein [Ignavibacteriaceae bacterium]